MIVSAEKSTKIIDSLENIVSKVPDSTKADIYSELCFRYSFQNVRKAVINGKNALKIAQNLGDSKRTAQAFNDLGIAFQRAGNYDSALSSHKSALDIREKLGAKRDIPASYSKMGLIYSERGDYEEALKCQLKAVNGFEQSGDKNAGSVTYSNIGQLLSHQKRFKESIVYYLKSHDLAVKIHNKYATGLSLFGLAYNYEEERKYEESLKWYKEAVSFFQQSGDKDAEARALNNMASCYKKAGNYQASLTYFQKVLSIDRSLNNEKGIASRLLNIAALYTVMGKYNEAKPLFETGILLAERNKLKPNLIEAYKEYASYFTLIKDYKNAARYLQLYSDLRDTVMNEERSKAFAEMQTKYETDKKQKEIELLNQQKEIRELALEQSNNQRNLLIVALMGILFISIGGFYLYRFNQQNKLSKALLEEQTLRLKAVIETQETERRRIAEELHDGVGQMLCVAKMNVSVLREEPEAENDLWDNLENIIDQSVSEVRNVSHAMMPSVLMKVGLKAALNEYIEQLNASKQIRVELICNNFDIRLDANSEVSVYRIIQELLSNAIKHGKAQRAWVNLDDSDGNLKVSVKDNGRGFNIDKLQTNSGNGWYNINSRISLLGGKPEIHSVIGEGTEVRFEVRM